jgi:hypothetical protein
MAIKSQQELYDLFITELQSIRPDLTDTSEGSIIDLIAGVVSVAVSELNTTTVEQFSKTFFDTANGPEITGGTDELEKLAIDHFGSEFSRPEASKATGTVTFSRPTSTSGSVLIPAGTVVKTLSNAAGNAQRFVTLTDVTMTGLTINASIEAAIAGPNGNVLQGTIVVIESTLTDSSITCTNSQALSGGADSQTDSEYRETIRNKIESLKGSSLAALQAKAKTVSGVVMATGIEVGLPVIEFDISTQGIASGASYFRVPYAYLYVADSNGTANQAMIDAVTAAIDELRAAGTKVEVLGATPVQFDWIASISLNPIGPNYGTLSLDTSMITDAMSDYINSLPIGTGFTKTLADSEIMALFGPSGSNDLTYFVTSSPSGDVSLSNNQKLIARTMGIN